MSEFIFEIFSEEIPARMQGGARASLKALATSFLQERGLSPSPIMTYTTPQRLVLHMTDLPLFQPAGREERRGPRVDGPAAAVAGFFKSVGMDPSACFQQDTEKGTFWVAPLHKPPVPMEEILPILMIDILTKLHWPKSMGWNAGTLRWVRPIRRLLSIFNGQVILPDLSSLGIKEELPVGRETQGHRFMSPEIFSVSTFEDYKEGLKKRHVILDQEERKTSILHQASHLAQSQALRLKEDPALLEEVAGLVEWPVALLGKMDPSYLSLPEEVLVTSMRQHQKFFALTDEEGKLAPFFLTVSNIDPQDGGLKVITGNQNVLKARLSDAAFFFQQDQQIPLEEHAKKLETLTFHRGLGGMDQKVKRVEPLALHILSSLPLTISEAHVKRASQLCKADLVTGMVREFPELQGIMGGTYAQLQGEPEAVASALRHHYAPQGPEDFCPKDPLTALLAIADKIDTLVGFFAIGEVPTGSKDPFGLRRAALGILRLLLENQWSLKLTPIFQVAYELYESQGIPLSRSLPHSLETLNPFLWERLKGLMKAQGIDGDYGEAVASLDLSLDPVDALRKAQALQKVLQTPSGQDVKTAVKRALNILGAEEQKTGQVFTGDKCQPTLLKEAAEKHLYDQVTQCESQIRHLLSLPDYEQALEKIAHLRPGIDEFFQTVTVNSPQPEERFNRLELLAFIRRLIQPLGDFKKLEG
jgi:glycyl-tRNA synthetase beta chain